MSSLIPHLRELGLGHVRFRVPPEFVFRFVKIHQSHAHSDVLGWRQAQRHWERIVEAVLDTDAIDPCADDMRAMRQAVDAASELLDRLALHDRCPLCAITR